MAPKMLHVNLLVLVFCMSIQLQLSVESDSIIFGERLGGNRTLTSKGRVFEMGFFAPPGNSHNYYIGIWYNYKRFSMPEKTVGWVANRDHPVSDPYSSWLEFDQDSGLVLRDSSGLAVWSTGVRSWNLFITAGTLGDDGNFVIRVPSDPYSDTWESFDNPTDTWLPGAKLGYDKETDITTTLTSWKDANNPALGHFSIKVNEVHPNFSQVKMLIRSGYYVYAYEYDTYLGDENECGSIAFSDSLH